MVSLEAMLKKKKNLRKEEKLMGSDKWSHVDYVIIKICLMS